MLTYSPVSKLFFFALSTRRVPPRTCNGVLHQWNWLPWEQRNCLKIWIRICQHRKWYYNMNRGRFCKRLLCCVFVIHIKPKHSFCSRTSFYSRRVSYENCKCPRRNYTPNYENCFAILLSVCNFHISLQFSYQFAILTFRCIVPTWTFAIFIWVCNFHMSLQFSYQFVILMSRLQHLLTRLCMYSMVWCTPRWIKK